MSQVTTAPARRTMRPVKKPVEKPAEKPCPDLPSFYRLLREHRNDLEGRWTEESGDLRFRRGKRGKKVICPLEFLWLVLSGKMEGFQTAAEELGLSASYQEKIVAAADSRHSSNRAIRQWLLWATGLSEKEPAATPAATKK